MELRPFLFLKMNVKREVLKDCIGESVIVTNSEICKTSKSVKYLNKPVLQSPFLYQRKRKLG